VNVPAGLARSYRCSICLSPSARRTRSARCRLWTSTPTATRTSLCCTAGKRMRMLGDVLADAERRHGYDGGWRGAVVAVRWWGDRWARREVLVRLVHRDGQLLSADWCAGRAGLCAASAVDVGQQWQWQRPVRARVGAEPTRHQPQHVARDGRRGRPRDFLEPRRFRGRVADGEAVPGPRQGPTAPVPRWHRPVLRHDHRSVSWLR
jgi:hypothetical protein